jgi:hypothetical protein
MKTFLQHCEEAASDPIAARGLKAGCIVNLKALRELIFHFERLDNEVRLNAIELESLQQQVELLTHQRDTLACHIGDIGLAMGDDRTSLTGPDLLMICKDTIVSLKTLEEQRDRYKVTHDRALEFVGRCEAMETELEYLRAQLKSAQEQEPIAYCYPLDAENLQTTECSAEVYSIPVGCPDGESTFALYAAPVPAIKIESKLVGFMDPNDGSIMKLQICNDESEKLGITFDPTLSAYSMPVYAGSVPAMPIQDDTCGCSDCEEGFPCAASKAMPIPKQEPIYMWQMDGDEGWIVCTKEWFEDIKHTNATRIVYTDPQPSQAAAIPVGFVLVPLEPNPAQQAAGAQAVRIDTTVINKMFTANRVYREMLSAAPKLAIEHDKNLCALKTISDAQVNAVARSFWRRIEPYKNDYGRELPEQLPVEFFAHMATALSWLEMDSSHG